MNAWHRKLEVIAESNDLKQAWEVMLALSSNAVHNKGRVLHYSGRLHASYKGMLRPLLTSASRLASRNTTNLLRKQTDCCVLKSATHSCPPIEAPIIIDELERALRPIMYGKAAGLGEVAPNLLMHFPLSVTSELLIFRKQRLTVTCCPLL